jgi:hypothetical protein
MSAIVKLPEISDEELTSTVEAFLGIVRIQQERKDEIARLKGNNPEPQIQPSSLDKSKKRHTT